MSKYYVGRDYYGYNYYGGYKCGVDSDKILSSKRVHIEKILPCECECECDQTALESRNDFCDCRIHQGFDGAHDRVVIEVDVDCALKDQTNYVLILSQPVPSDGFNLPVEIKVHFCDKGYTRIFPLKKGYERGCGLCDVEFGEDLPHCRNRIPLYFTNGGDFIDLRKGQCPI